MTSKPLTYEKETTAFLITVPGGLNDFFTNYIAAEPRETPGTQKPVGSGKAGPYYHQRNGGICYRWGFC